MRPAWPGLLIFRAGNADFYQCNKGDFLLFKGGILIALRKRQSTNMTILRAKDATRVSKMKERLWI